jgi:hypothetical protein
VTISHVNVLMVFKSVLDLLSATAPGWTFSMSVVCVIKIMPRISREASDWLLLHPGSSSFSSRASCWRLLLASLIAAIHSGSPPMSSPRKDEVEGGRAHGVGVVVAEDAVAAGQEPGRPPSRHTFRAATAARR